MYTDDALMKSVLLDINQATKKWSMHIHNWKIILNQFLAIFEKGSEFKCPPLFSSYTVNGIA